jgi:hypothetical protein
MSDVTALETENKYDVRDRELVGKVRTFLIANDVIGAVVAAVVAFGVYSAVTPVVAQARQAMDERVALAMVGE